MSFHVIVFRLFREVKTVELQPSRDFLLSFEQGQRNLQVVVGDQHAQGDEGVGDAQDSNHVFLLKLKVQNFPEI